MVSENRDRLLSELICIDSSSSGQDDKDKRSPIRNPSVKKLERLVIKKDRVVEYRIKRIGHSRKNTERIFIRGRSRDTFRKTEKWAIETVGHYCESDRPIRKMPNKINGKIEERYLNIDGNFDIELIERNEWSGKLRYNISNLSNILRNIQSVRCIAEDVKIAVMGRDRPSEEDRLLIIRQAFCPEPMLMTLSMID